MPIARVRFSLARLMLVTTALGVNFGVVPWPSCIVMGAAITLPLFLSSATLIEWVVLYAVAGVLAGLSMPAVVTNCRRGRISAPPAAPPAPEITSGDPDGESPVDHETPER